MNNYDEVKQSFSIQAEKLATYHMSKAEYTDYLIRSIQAKGNEHTLEVAAGTCICGRALAPYVKDMVCLDLTEAMLEQGRILAEQDGIRNISFVTGNATSLPFEDESFDLVVTRLSLHHFTEPEKPFREMQRVLKKGGKLVVWDNFDLQLKETTLVPVNLQSWMDLTNIPEDVQKEIVNKMDIDLNGGAQTGFYPYVKEGQVWFDHRWLLLIGIKR